VLPDEDLAAQARAMGVPPDVAIRIGGLAGTLRGADLAITKTGTVTVECAYFGVPAVTLYKTSWLTYQIARRLVTVGTLTMPNLLAGEPVYPELLQSDATGPNIARVAGELLGDPARRAEIRSTLARVVGALGGPGASDRAAAAICRHYAARPPAFRASLA
jgi:lipid-A-disaccharide synthase